MGGQIVFSQNLCCQPGVFSLQAPTLVMTKGLGTFAGPKNAQNNDFFMYTINGSDLKIFDQI